MAIRESFLHKIGGHGIFGGTREQAAKVFFVKELFSPIRETFSHESFPQYGTW